MDGSRAVTTPSEGDKEQPAKGHQGAAASDTLQVVARVDQRRHGDQRERAHEEASETVDTQGRVETAAEIGTDRRRSEQDEGADDAQQRDTRYLESECRRESPTCHRRQRAGDKQRAPNRVSSSRSLN